MLSVRLGLPLCFDGTVVKLLGVVVVNPLSTLGRCCSTVVERQPSRHNRFQHLQHLENHKRRARLTFSTATMAESLVAVKQEEAKQFMIKCLQAAGSEPGPAEEQADVMLEADRQGHFSHGMNRLASYCNDLLLNACDSKAKPTVVKESASTAFVDGQNTFGATVGNFCMNLAIQKAKETGVGWVVAHRSNHYGIAGWYSMKALKEGMIGMSFTNTSPLMAPTRSKERCLGTNPISLAAPAENGDRFVLDMATTAVAVGKIEIQRQKGEPLPLGWAQAPDGLPTTDAGLAFEEGCLMPLGGPELTSGYKGYGLSAMVEILCGISAGSLYGQKVRQWAHTGQGGAANLGQCFIAMDPSNFAPGFDARMSDLLGQLRGLEATDPNNKVLAPGDKERANVDKADATGVINYHMSQINACEALANQLKVKNILYTKM
ncbi:putative oxidoreductase YjmC [Arctopsyche grandis]|uniref:putative oxidoreductase YjmC n=1 Tax=Arctopsyche grandis TaxID=121162 RepID=UPI00406D8466